MNRELSLHPDSLEVIKLLLESLWVLELYIGRINRRDAVGMATQGEPLPCEVQLLVTFTAINFEVSCEVISSKGRGNKA